ncbi:hypothetical protein H8356DRAFT_163209 [Neocallimastix lanati (nom. inval.)]|nr:hypothetical protein H8356DRAFT_163209 [Neocallimastix sp. JGI-2020a]
MLEEKMYIKSFILLVLATLAFALPEDEVKVDHPDVDIEKIDNRIEFITNFQHQPVNNKEGGTITITYSPPTKDAEKAKELVKSFSIAIGTGSDTNVDEEFFMESERLPIPTGDSTYIIQLPPQMEKKQYCIVYTPYSTATVEEGNAKPVTKDGTPLESLYETWFAIDGSLEVGTGPKNAVNSYDNSAAAQANTQGQGTDRSAEGQTVNTQAGSTNGSITISPAITLFIAVVFACFFI